ncbi:hypothetical protein LZZ90_05290 [Flavobacterium sp. SM15]|uniref:hypothetical protein n=1 Tax=Flavobacterium sp. SM15 TaxID=2908005 RepID=UPI001EDAF210|nr:hypothetical protein [Flavobacterium sp. SM15]MCG2610914.1 hypothetical protein [Flavobacterium sp. SM15]
MKPIIDQLKECIRSHPAVLNSSIGKIRIWKRTQFIVLSEIITEALSKSEFFKDEKTSSISSMTLQRLFDESYMKKVTPDLRFLKTLDKLAIFLGHPSLNSFLAFQNGTNEKTETSENNLPCPFEQLIQDFCQEELNCLQQLPSVSLGNINDYIFEESPLYNRILDTLTKFSNRNISIAKSKKQSFFEVFDCKLISVDEDLMILSAKESWNLEWQNGEEETLNLYNKINRQTYFIKQQGNHWKIWDNYNPDCSSLISEVMEETEKKMVL